MTAESDLNPSPALSHLDEQGRASMVDVSGKPVTVREARASAEVQMIPRVLDALLSNSMPKGDAVATARIAGIQAAKRTSELIPLCHAIALDHVAVEFDRLADNRLRISCTARSRGATGVEMEALTGASVAALVIYDMAKAADRAMIIGQVQLEQKSGGRSGDYSRTQSVSP